MMTRVNDFLLQMIQGPQKVLQKSSPLEDSLPLSERHDLNTFSMSRIFKKGESSHDESDGMVDAVLAFVAKLENIPDLNLVEKGQVIMSYMDGPVQISETIHLKIEELLFDPESGKVEKISLILMSERCTSNELADFVRKLYEEHLEELKNSLKNTTYYFEYKPKDINPGMCYNQSLDARRNYKISVIQSAPKQLSFSMSPFYSNKRFENIYGKDIRDIEKRVNFFLNNREWYDKKGIPYQLSMLFSGISGAGKTSVIRAIANKTKRHIVNVNFANISTATQLKNMFFSDRIQVASDSMSPQTYFIPIHQRLYVLEELDALGDIVKQRTSSQSSSVSIPDELTLGEILSVLDGAIEVPGRMIIMTTNHPEILDRALVRPGRVDLKVHSGKASRELIAEMFKGYRDHALEPFLVQQIPDQKMSPAEVSQILFRHIENPDEFVIKDLLEFQPEKEPVHDTISELEKYGYKLLTDEDRAIIDRFIKEDNGNITSRTLNKLVYCFSPVGDSSRAKFTINTLNEYNVAEKSSEQKRLIRNKLMNTNGFVGQEVINIIMYGEKEDDLTGYSSTQEDNYIQ